MENASTYLGETFYEEILAFDHANRQLDGALIDARTREWHDAAIKTMLRAQAHFFGHSEPLKLLIEDLWLSPEYQEIQDDLAALRATTKLPFPVCWFEVAYPGGHRCGFALERQEDPWCLKLTTFQTYRAGYPVVVGLCTIMGDFTADWIKIESAPWLEILNPKDVEQTKAHMRSIVAILSLINSNFDDFNLDTCENVRSILSRRAAEKNWEKIAEDNRNYRYPFIDMCSYLVDPERPVGFGRRPDMPRDIP